MGGRLQPGTVAGFKSEWRLASWRNGWPASLGICKLLHLLAMEGAIVSIDAMGCRRDIAKKIIDKIAAA
jgi:hypothetical protein